MSKNFVSWFAKTDAARFGKKGIRVVGISPGTFETPMGELEKESAEEYLKYCAIKRPGKVEEIAHLMAFCVSEKASYLTGVDIYVTAVVLQERSKIVKPLSYDKYLNSTKFIHVRYIDYFCTYNYGYEYQNIRF